MKRSILIAVTATLALAPAAQAATGAGYLLKHQRRSGGIAEAGTRKASVSLTEWAAMGLRAAGASCAGRSVAHAYDYLTTVQTSSHGYALLPAGAANSQSTSWAVQARHRCGLRNRRALAWLHARQLPSGAYNYQPGLTTTPAWVTGQVLPAVNGRAYPIT